MVDLNEDPKLSTLDPMILTFAGDFPKPHLSIICDAPFPDVNKRWRAAAEVRLAPYLVAIDADMVREDTYKRLWVTLYAEGAIVESETDGFGSFESKDWVEWLLQHPDHFEELAAILDHRPNWGLREELDDHGRYQPGLFGAAPGEGDDPPRE